MTLSGAPAITPASAPARLINIQGLRGVAALLVFAAHLTGAERDYGGGGEGAAQLLPSFLHIGVIGVDLFFLISGYVMAHVTFAKPRGPAAAARFAYDRAARIYPVYWMATLLLVALYAGKAALFGEATPLDNLFASMLLLPDDALPVLPVGWTLVHELYFYLVFAIFLSFRKPGLTLLLGSWTTLLIVAEIAGWRDLNPWTRLIFSPLTFQFIAGAAIALLVRRGVTGFAITALLAGVASVLVLMIPLEDNVWPDAFIDQRTRAAIFTVPLALILYGAAALEANAGSTSPAWLRRLGDASYALYLIHIPVFLMVGKLISLATGAGLLDNAFLLAAYIASGLASAFLIHKYAEKPLLRVTRRLGDSLFRPKQAIIPEDKVW